MEKHITEMWKWLISSPDKTVIVPETIDDQPPDRHKKRLRSEIELLCVLKNNMY